MAKKQKQLPPRRKRMTRPVRLQGRTAAGFAFGVTWEEMEAVEAEERESTYYGN
jgi:hypothetical protein